MREPQAVQDKVIDVGSMVLRSSALTGREKAYVALGCAVALRCTHCHGAMVRLARKLEATAQEIEQAEAIAQRVRQPCENETGVFLLTD
ncbi:MAG: carboxymuconolactone decarboxylase family protein [Planctomycetota bacterium]